VGETSLKLAPLATPAPSGDDGQAATALIDALHSLRVAITVFDSAERIVFSSEHLNRVFRSLPPREKLVGLTYEQLIRLEVAGGEIAESAIVDLPAFIARRRAQFGADEIRPLDVVLSSGRVVEIKVRRTHAGWIALWSDVTHARHAQTRLEDVVALSADAFAFFNKTDTLAVCNDAYAGFFGFSSALDIIGRSFAELMELARTSERLLRREPPEEWLEKRVAAHRAPAGVMTVELVTGEAYVMRDRATVEGGRIVVFTDITDRHRVEMALEEQKKTLAETRTQAEQQANYLADLARRFDRAAADADTTKTTLMRTMSHELRTPLNAIIGFSDLMQSMAENLRPEQVKEYAAMIHEGGRNLLRLINQILDLTKLSAGRYKLQRTTIDAAAALWSTCSTYEARAREKDIVLESEATPDLVLKVDESALNAMLSQLLDNALNFTPPGGKVSLAAERADGIVRVRVSDNGPGVAADDIARILRPFEQGGRGTSDHTAGAGLGLTLVKALAELHGGALEIESVPGAGFAAVIILPANPA
jgi:two-component system cell cycle sensor histidine kinase PleC